MVDEQANRESLITQAAYEVRKELERVIHEGYRKLEAEVMQQDPDVQRLFRKALHVATMGLRFMVDLYPEVLRERQGPALYACGCRLDCGPICMLHGTGKIELAPEESRNRQLLAIEYAIQFLKDTLKSTSSRSMGECEHAIDCLERERDIIGGPTR